MQPIRKYTISMLRFAIVLLARVVGAQSPTPAKSHFREVKVENKALLEMLKGEKKFSLSQLRVYNHKGLQVADFGSGEDDTFPANLARVLQSPPKENSKTLESETKALVEKDGKPLNTLPDADFTIVEYWADWCAPCRTQSAQLKKVIASQPGLSINVLHVEADPMKLPELKGKIKKQK